MDTRIMKIVAISTIVIVVGLSVPQSANALGSSTLIDRIIETFGLNKDQVQTVVNDYRTERQTQIAQAFEERLNQAVQDGELTEEKKKLILEKQAELDKWAADNGIDLWDIFGRGMGMGKGMGHGWNRR